MALGTITVVEKVAAVGPTFTAHVSVVGDSAYSTGGTTGLLAALQAALKDSNLAILSASPCDDNAGYFPVYIKSTDKLKIYQCGGSAAPMAEDTTGNQSARTYHLKVVLY